MNHLTADRSACLGAGQCAYHAPTLFDQDEDDGLVIVLTAHPTGTDLPTAHRAVSSCPNSALTLAEDPSEDHFRGTTS